MVSECKTPDTRGSFRAPTVTIEADEDVATAKEVAERSILIKNMLEDVGESATNESIPIPNVSCHNDYHPIGSLTQHQVNEAVLKKVIEWCEHHRGDPPATADDDSDSRKKTTDIEEWDQKFMQVDQEMLFEIILVGKLPSTHTSLP